MMDFSNVKGIVIPEGEVAEISRNGETLWRKQKYKRKLAYLQSTGTQYIDPMFVPNNNTRVVMDAEITENTGTHQCLFGVRVTGANFYAMRHSNGRFYAYYGNTSPSVGNIELLGRRVYDLNKNVWTVGDNTVAATINEFSSTGSLHLFKTANYSGYTYAAHMKLYSCQIYDNGIIVRDLIPVLDWDDVPCMYDKVTDELFYNLGTGEFLYE